MSCSLKLEMDRVAGESQVVVYLDRDTVDVQYISSNNERLFEQLTIKRSYREVPYITSRICGFCSHSHFWASNLALENALGVEVDEATASLRDACSKLQMIDSHIVHLVLLALPDYRKPDVDVIKSALKVRKAVAAALDLISGRLSNPPPYIPGGFVVDVSRWRIERAVKIVDEIIPVVDSLVDYIIESVNLYSLQDPSPNYLALSEWPEKSVPVKSPYELVGADGRVTVDADNYTSIFTESLRSYSRSRECTLRGTTFFVGPRARMIARGSVYGDSHHLNTVKLNPYGNLIARALETRFVIRGVRNTLVECMDRRPRKVDPVVRGGRGLAVVEAPRGLLLHYYEVNSSGVVEKTDIITPTAMFTKHIENSAKALATNLMESGRVDDIARYVEMLVRSYDPCIPCAVHVVRVR